MHHKQYWDIEPIDFDYCTTVERCEIFDHYEYTRMSAL